MHGRLYVCLPKDEARTPPGVIKKVSRFLREEGFLGGGLLWGGPADYFEVCGRWVGSLELLRLRARDARKFDAWWKAYGKPNIDTEAKAVRLFRQHFKDYKGTPPVFLDSTAPEAAWGEIDIIDAGLFEQLQSGFGEFNVGDWELHEPNVIFTDFTEERDAESIVGNYWVAVIDYSY